MLVKLVHSVNALALIVVTLSGILIEVKLVHSEKASVSRVITLLGILILVKLLQPANAPYLILVTVSGISILVRLVQAWNAQSPMVVTPDSIMTDVMYSRASASSSYQGASNHPYPSISPVPLIVNTPSSSSVHVRFSPHVPLSTISAACA